MVVAAEQSLDAVAKGDFARLCNVTPGRVSQWISEGKISGAALVGEGRSAKICVSIAKAQLRSKIDVGQRFGNGLSTQLDLTPPPRLAAPAHPAAAPAPVANEPPAPQAVYLDPLDNQIKRERLREIEGRNRRTAEEDLARRGIFTRTDEVRSAMAGLASGLVNVFEGSLSDLASSIATKFGLSQRDVLHLLRSDFRAVREKASDASRRAAQRMAAIKEDNVPDATDDAMGEA